MAILVDWDENKNRANFLKHGIEFPAVVAVFDDPLFVTLLDPFPNEERFRTIGAALNGILFVVHTIQELSGGDELYWIISARYATSVERKAYEEGSTEEIASQPPPTINSISATCRKSRTGPALLVTYITP